MVQQTETISYITAAAMIVFTQRALKNFAWYDAVVRNVPGASKWAHWLIAGVGSLVAAAGIDVAWNWSAATGGQLTVAVPDASTLFHGFGQWVQVYVLQHTIYEGTRPGFAESAPVPPPIVQP